MSPVCTPTKKMGDGDRHALFKRMYGDRSTLIQVQVIEGRSWPEIKLILLRQGHISNYLLRACQREAEYWKAAKLKVGRHGHA